MCVNRDCTVYFNAHTQYGMCTTHCIIWYLVEAVESFNILSHKNFKNSKICSNYRRNGLLYVSPFEIVSNM